MMIFSSSESTFFTYKTLPTTYIIPFLRKIILSESSSISCMLCDVKKTIQFFLSSFIRSITYCWFIGSKPFVGSSKNIIYGLPMEHIATLNLLFIPPDKF